MKIAKQKIEEFKDYESKNKILSPEYKGFILVNW